MKAEDATDTLTMALQASGCDSARVVQRPRLLSGAWQLLGLRVSPQGLLRILSERLGVPFVTTVHGRLDLPGLPDVAREFSSASFVAISDTQRQQLPDAKWIATIQHGLPSCLFRPSYEPGSYLAFLGRLTAEKGPLDAIRIAQACEMPLRIAAKIPRAETAFCTPLSLRLRHGEKLSCLPGWNGS